MKLCKDCKWCELDPQGDTDFAKCRSPKNRRHDLNPVDGGHESLKPRYVYCHYHREDNFDRGACQRKARWFEPKELSAASGGEGDA